MYTILLILLLLILVVLIIMCIILLYNNMYSYHNFVTTLTRYLVHNIMKRITIELTNSSRMIRTFVRIRYQPESARYFSTRVFLPFLILINLVSLA